MSSSYCSSCKIEISNEDIVRDHYKSEFHRYNVKRKLVDLPPVTLDQFSKKKAQLMAESSQSDRDQLLKCEPCGKTFASKATYKQHLESKKHRDNLKKFNLNGKDSGKADEDKVERSSKNTAEDQTVCLFCNIPSTSIEENLVHMRLAHSFFISEIRHLKDLQGLLRYLGSKIHRRKMCIYCGVFEKKDNKTTEGIQQHMLAKGHIFMNTEDFREYMRFYDFSKVYENLQKQDLIEDATEDVIVEEDESEEEEEREDDDHGSWEVIEDDEAGAGARRHLNWRVKTAKVTGTGELQLPNGHVIGHRQYKVVYKQHLRSAARTDSTNTSVLDYDEGTIGRREEEARLAKMNNEVMRKERTRVDSQVHNQLNKKDREGLRLSMRSYRIQHVIRRDQL